MPLFNVAYDSNNSGGRWWLADKDWYALEGAGWKVSWVKDIPSRATFLSEEDGRWLGALATSASKEFKARDEYIAKKYAIIEWEDITGEHAYDSGCNCCGQPHNFYVNDIK